MFEVFNPERLRNALLICCFPSKVLRKPWPLVTSFAVKERQTIWIKASVTLGDFLCYLSRKIVQGKMPCHTHSSQLFSLPKGSSSEVGNSVILRNACRHAATKFRCSTFTGLLTSSNLCCYMYSGDPPHWF